MNALVHFLTAHKIGLQTTYFFYNFKKMLQNEPLGTVLKNISSQNNGEVLANFLNFHYIKTKKGKTPRFS